MIHFDRDQLDWFIGIVRKYMHLRWDLNQKDLAEQINVGISTLSRFLNQKTKEIDEQIVAKIVAGLEIPLHEIIDFIEEDSTERFRKLIAFYKEETMVTQLMPASGDPVSEATQSVSARVGRKGTRVTFAKGNNEPTVTKNMSVSEKFKNLSPRQKAYLTDFLDLDSEARDVIVDVGNQLLRYFKQKSLQL